MHKTVQTVLPPLKPRRRLPAALLLAVPVVLAGAAGATDVITADLYTGVGSKIATYFGYAVAAVVILAGTVIAGKFGLQFLKSLFSKGT